MIRDLFGFLDWQPVAAGLAVIAVVILLVAIWDDGEV